jgi:hypothetical protein
MHDLATKSCSVGAVIDAIADKNALLVKLSSNALVILSGLIK